MWVQLAPKNDVDDALWLKGDRVLCVRDSSKTRPAAATRLKLMPQSGHATLRQTARGPLISLPNAPLLLQKGPDALHAWQIYVVGALQESCVPLFVRASF